MYSVKILKVTKGQLCGENKIFWCSDHGGAYMESHHHLKKTGADIQGQTWINRKSKVSKILYKIKSITNTSRWQGLDRWLNGGSSSLACVRPLHQPWLPSVGKTLVSIPPGEYPSYIKYQSRKCPIDMPISHSDGSNAPTEVPLPRWLSSVSSLQKPTSTGALLRC